MLERLLVAVLCVFAVGVVAKGRFQPVNSLNKIAPLDVFSTERLVSFRGGFDRGDDFPDRARRPQPLYDNTIYRGATYFQHELTYLEDNLILDWQPTTGEYKVFKVVKKPVDQCPVIPEEPITSGVWESRKYHKLAYIGCSGAPGFGGKILDYNPVTGDYDIFRFNHKVQPGENPLGDESISRGFRREIMNFQALYVNDDEIMFYEPATGMFSVYYLNNQLPSKIDPMQPSEPITFGKLQGLHTQLIYLGNNMIMDYDQSFGRFWLYHYDRTAVNNTSPLVGPVGSGVLEGGMLPTYLADDQILLLNPETGMFGAFVMNRPANYDAFAEAQKPEQERELERTNQLSQKVEGYDIKMEPGNFGFGSIAVASQCSSEESCKGCLGVAGCGWCGTSNKCMRGSTVQPCATNCTQWQPVFCDAEPCSSHKGCSSCLSDPFCGWCADSMQCTEGVGSGPLFGSCEGWSKTVCPSLSFSEDVTVNPPCVDEGLISL